MANSTQPLRTNTNSNSKNSNNSSTNTHLSIKRSVSEVERREGEEGMMNLNLDFERREIHFRFAQRFQSLAVHPKKVAAEFVGTFLLVFAAAATPIVDDEYGGAETLLGKAASAGVAVTVIVIATGHISGAHLNPSVSVALAALRHFPWAHVPAYVAAQLSGSVGAAFALKAVFHPAGGGSGGVTVPAIPAGRAFLLEFLISFILLFVITAVATDSRAHGEFAGVAVGGTVLMNILIAGPSTGGSMNPARTLGPAIAARNYHGIWIYILAPTLGAIAGAGTYDLMKFEE